ncbi:MAG TPA: hypothetical protein VM118_01055 [Acidobacteriota bacterium]|nr:hypothetical protein [Acidobacteriota bacterium]
MSVALRRLAHSGGLVAAAFALKYPLVAVPNVEPLTLAFFAVGYAYGPLWGLFVGLLSEGIYTTFNPLGAPIFPVWVAQIVSMGGAGFLGGVMGWMLKHTESRRVRVVAATVGGVVATLIFDLLTNFAFAWAIGPFWPVLAAAVPFAVIHVGSNALLFAVIFPILERWLLRPTTVVIESPAR